jgi:hypothetical protein
MEPRPTALPARPSDLCWTLSLAVVAVFFGSTARWANAAEDAGRPPDARGNPAQDAPTVAPADFTGTPIPPPRDAELPPQSVSTGQKRPLPQYDGRTPAPGTPGETFVWGPRALLFPAHLVAEYALRRPLVGLVTFGEKHFVWPRIYRFFTWNDGHAGIYPIFDVDVGRESTAGASFFSEETVASPNDLHTSASFGGEGVINLRLRDHVSLWSGGQGGAYVHATWVRRPDGMYFGPSGLTRQSDLRYYSYDDRALEFGVDGKLGGMNHIAAELGVRDIGFGTDTRTPDRPSIATSFGGATGPPLPAGFGGYGLVRPRIVLVLDSRDPVYEHPTGTGVRLETDVLYGRSFSDTAFTFVGWGAALAGFWDISGVNHVLAFEIATRFVEPISGAAIPFTELPSLGGREFLRGFFDGRFRDQSAFSATLQYRYPIWIYVDSEIFAGVGNVFPGHLQGIDPASLFLSYGCGLRTTFSREVSLVATVAAGTRRFDDPNFRAVDTTRFLFGAVHGF